MSGAGVLDLGLKNAYDELFMDDGGRAENRLPKIRELHTDEISSFPNHPFKLRMDESMTELVDSVKQYGVLSPVLVRSMPDGSHQMVSGHRRKKAAELAGLGKVPCIIRELTDDEAIIVMVDSNLQREKILPSEKAFAYKMRLEAMKRQGHRTDLTCAPVAHKLNGRKSRDILAEQAGESKDQVRRYIRLTSLIPEILDMVDNSVLKESGVLQMAMRPAVELSYLSELEQRDLLETMTIEDCTPSLAQAVKLREFSKNGKLNADVILSIMCEEKPNQKERISFRAERLRQFIPKSVPLNQTEDYVLKALEYYQRYRDRQRQRDMER